MKARIAVSVVLAATLMLGTTGCSFFASIATLKHYDPSDGIGANVGDVKVRNAIVLMKGEGDEASLVVNLLNASNEEIRLTVQYDSGTEQVNEFIDLPAGSVTSFGGENDDKIVLQGLKTKPGELFPIWFQYADKTGKELLVPVLDGTQVEYSGLLPTPSATPTNIPGATLTPTPTPSATAR